MLKNVFDNLVSNAVKFTPDEGIISISLKSDGKHALCLVEDSGPGIDEGDRSLIFSPFFQGKGAEKAVVNGLNCLASSLPTILSKFAGSIRLLTSKNGARFLVTLPLSG